MSSDSMFCEKCGKQIKQNIEKDTIEEEKIEHIPLKEKTDDNIPKRFCPYCKAKIYDEDARICTQCGKSIQ